MLSTDIGCILSKKKQHLICFPLILKTPEILALINPLININRQIIFISINNLWKHRGNCQVGTVNDNKNIKCCDLGVS